MTNEQIMRETLEGVASFLDSHIIKNFGRMDEDPLWKVNAAGIVSQFNVVKTVLRITEPEPEQWIPPNTDLGDRDA